jgi:hypothetical protein
MVLIRLGWLCILACAACSQSLFDAHGPGGSGGPGGGDDDGNGPTACNAPCVADAAIDFDGTATGKNQRWRYLDDHRDRTWTAMTPSSTKMTGADAANHIATCAANPGAAACAMIPDALLVSSSSSTSAADPAIEFTAPAQQVLKLSVKVFMASGGDQTIRLYRNGRPDALFTGLATAGTLLDQTITVDALAQDRFLVAMAPMTAGASDVAIQFIATSAGKLFPQDCLLAVGFAGATGNTVSDLCKSISFTHYDAMTQALPVTLGDDPFGEKNAAANYALGTDFETMQTIPQNTTLTVQLWVRQRTVPSDSAAWLFSDIDLTDDAYGGLGIGLGINGVAFAQSPLTLNGNTIEVAEADTSWPGVGDWHFIRVVQTAGNLSLCIDGKPGVSVAIPDGHLRTVEPLLLGRNRFGQGLGEPFFDGDLDDVRIFKGALPCD